MEVRRRGLGMAIPRRSHSCGLPPLARTRARGTAFPGLGTPLGRSAPHHWSLDGLSCSRCWGPAAQTGQVPILGDKRRLPTGREAFTQWKRPLARRRQADPPTALIAYKRVDRRPSPPMPAPFFLARFGQVPFCLPYGRSVAVRLHCVQVTRAERIFLSNRYHVTIEPLGATHYERRSLAVHR
jgi:hypothetical protein